jgi:hypothetical protein
MRKVHVLLIDAASNATIAEVDLEATQLPEAFELSTRLEIAGRMWQVEQAEPPTREAYIASGRLRLVLRELQHVDPRSLLFSLPTLENVAPPTEPLVDGCVTMHEDDWRQVELVSARLELEIAAELEAIRLILTSHRKGVGFTNLHARSRIPEPLAGVALSLADLGMATAPRGLAIGTRTYAAIVGGFAFDTEAGTLYGRVHQQAIVALGVHSSRDLGLLAVVARAGAFVVVDWCAATMHRFDAASRA